MPSIKNALYICNRGTCVIPTAPAYEDHEVVVTASCHFCTTPRAHQDDGYIVIVGKLAQLGPPLL